MGYCMSPHQLINLLYQLVSYIPSLCVPPLFSKYFRYMQIRSNTYSLTAAIGNAGISQRSTRALKPCQGSACVAGNVWKRISLRCGLGNHDGDCSMTNSKLCTEMMFKKDVKCMTKVVLIWTNLSCCTSVNLRKPLPDVFWDDDEWISQCMRKDNQARSYIFKMKLSTSNFSLPINLHTCNNRKDQEKGTLVSLSMLKVDKLAINNFFVTNQWKFLLIGEKGERAEREIWRGADGVDNCFHCLIFIPTCRRFPIFACTMIPQNCSSRIEQYLKRTGYRFDTWRYEALRCSSTRMGQPEPKDWDERVQRCFLHIPATEKGTC